jgi:hypothetical protein
MRERDASDVFALLNTALLDAGWLVPIRLRQTAAGAQVWVEGIDMETAEELALTIRAGLDARVIRS